MSTANRPIVRLNRQERRATRKSGELPHRVAPLRPDGTRLRPSDVQIVIMAGRPTVDAKVDDILKTDRHTHTNVRKARQGVSHVAQTTAIGLADAKRAHRAERNRRNAFAQIFSDDGGRSVLVMDSQGSVRFGDDLRAEIERRSTWANPEPPGVPLVRG